ncbi:hypothetical protein Shyhy01_02250 [Streptomyces hygroscopicus subsp. hygroscopicus]|nr:hypothetical protein Shyhy01_02250 [Streptomyces hygroscopicus subsp. hygroscopicus]
MGGERHRVEDGDAGLRLISASRRACSRSQGWPPSRPGGAAVFRRRTGKAGSPARGAEKRHRTDIFQRPLRIDGPAVRYSRHAAAPSFARKTRLDPYPVFVIPLITGLDRRRADALPGGFVSPAYSVRADPP